MSRIDEYRRCAAAGMSKAETARALGVAQSSVKSAAKRHGIVFVDKRVQHCSEALRQKWADPAYRAARSEHARKTTKRAWARGDFDGRRSPRLAAVSLLTAPEYEDYRTYMAAGYRRAQALRAIGRADLVEAKE